MAERRTVRATTSFATSVDGRRVRVQIGQRFPASDPVVKHAPSLFEPWEDTVEQATAAPGEKRARAKRTANG
jgi:hypothetical protein